MLLLTYTPATLSSIIMSFLFWKGMTWFILRWPDTTGSRKLSIRAYENYRFLPHATLRRRVSSTIIVHFLRALVNQTEEVDSLCKHCWMHTLSERSLCIDTSWTIVPVRRTFEHTRLYSWVQWATTSRSSVKTGSGFEAISHRHKLAERWSGYRINRLSRMRCSSVRKSGSFFLVD